MATGYDTDLRDEQWALVAPFVRAEYGGLGPYHKVSRRAILDALLYQNRTGCQWRLIPHEYPNWHTVRHYYDLWWADGTWERIHEALNVRVRVRAGKQATPSVLIAVQGDDEQVEASISAQVLTVDRARRPAVRDALNDINARPSFVTAFITVDSRVYAYICVELAFTTDHQAAIRLGLKRLLRWIGAHYGQIAQASQGKRKTTKLDRQLAQILRGSEGGR